MINASYLDVIQCFQTFIYCGCTTYADRTLYNTGVPVWCVQVYMQKHQFGSVTTDDLWRALSSVGVCQLKWWWLMFIVVRRFAVGIYQ